MPVPPRLRKGGSRPAITHLSTIAEEDEEQRGQRKKRRKRQSDHSLKTDEKKSSQPDSSTSGHGTYNVHCTSDAQHSGKTAEPLGLKLDERQRLARERREEKEKQIAMKEAQLFEREERARQYYEKQVEEKKRRLDEQRLKEERRRAAVEEKRRQNLEEEKARNEAVMRRTMERSQRARPKSNRWSCGVLLPTSTSHNRGSDDSAALIPLDLAGMECCHGAFSLARQQHLRTHYADRRSVSTVNLSKHMEPVINKRLSSSSATLLNSPDRGLGSGMRRLPLTAWEVNIVSRLQTPTHSYLARSRSAMSLSGDIVTPICPRSASCHHAMSKSQHSHSTERPARSGFSLERPVRAGLDSSTQRKTTHNILVDRKDKDYVRKSWSNLSCPISTLTPICTKRASSPGSQRFKSSQAFSVRSSTEPLQKPPISKRHRSPPASLPLSRSSPSLSSGNLRPNRVTPQCQRAVPEREKIKEENQNSIRESEEANIEDHDDPEETKKVEREEFERIKSPVKAAPKAEPAIERVVSPPAVKPSTGTTDPEEASRLLAEKRRQAREQREKEEEERRQKEQAEKRHREEMALKTAEERAKREQEAQRLAEEKKQMEEEENRRIAEEKQRKESEEAELLLKQKEEEEARQREEAQRLHQAREKHFQKEEAERLERKKRLEEIMKRTRRSDQKSSSQGNGEVAQQDVQVLEVNVVPGVPLITVSAPQTSESSEHSDVNGHPDSSISLDTLTSAGHSVSTEIQLRENGVSETQDFEEVIEVPMVTKLSRSDGDGEEDREMRKSPLLAFRENGSAHDLNTMELSQAPQQTDEEEV